EARHRFGRWLLTAKGNKDFEGGVAGPVIELKAEGVDAIHVPRFLHRKNMGQFVQADVHVQRFGLNVEKPTPGHEPAELSHRLTGGRVIGDDDMDLSQLLERTKHLLTSLRLEFDGPAIG